MAIGIAFQRLVCLLLAAVFPGTNVSIFSSCLQECNANPKSFI
jgi:hypothetical protein